MFHRHCLTEFVHKSVTDMSRVKKKWRKIIAWDMDAGCLNDEKRTRTENICVTLVSMSDFGALLMTKHYINTFKLLCVLCVFKNILWYVWILGN
jgi:hypothetical protein